MFDELAEVEENEDYKIYWGLGVGIMEFQNKKYVFHWGDNGVFKSYFIYCLEDDIGFTYFANGSYGLAIRNKLSRSIFGYDVPMWPGNYIK